jgi:hypothetical protein
VADPKILLNNDTKAETDGDPEEAAPIFSSIQFPVSTLHGVDMKGV